MVLEKTLESPLECKEIKPVNPNGNQSLIFIGRTDNEAEAPILWPADEKNYLEKTVVSPLECKEIKPVNPNGNQPRMFIGRTDAEAEAPIFWPSDAKSQIIGKDTDAGKD